VCIQFKRQHLASCGKERESDCAVVSVGDVEYFLHAYPNTALKCDVNVAGFTGIDQQYEQPSNPEVILKAGESSVDECVQQLVHLLATRVRSVTIIIISIFCKAS